jgi:hypothetical protein
LQITVRAFGVGRVRLGRHIHSELLLGLFLLYLAGKPENVEKDMIRFLVIRGLLTAKRFRGRELKSPAVRSSDEITVNFICTVKDVGHGGNSPL